MKFFFFSALCLLMLGTGSTVKSQFTNYITSNSNIPSNFVCGGVAVDNNNNIWIGTDAGVAKYDGTNWSIFTTSDGLPSDIISCIAVDTANNNIWIGTDGDGVAKYDGTTWTKYTYSANGLCDNGIHYIAVDTDGSIWFGSWGAGISKLSSSTWTTYSSELPSESGAIASIYYITVDASNNKWFGTDMGLVKYDGSTWTTINQSTTANLKSNYITTVAVDSVNNTWLGMASKGIAKLNSSNSWIANYDTTNGICNNGIQDIKIDSKGNMWLGEYTIYGSLIVGGITKFNTATGNGVSYTSTEGMINEQVFKIAIDNINNVWIATGGGLLKFVTINSIKENFNNNYFDIYPNPAHEYFNIKSNLLSGIAEIYDITGSVISSQTISFPVIINTKNLTNGIYFIKVLADEKIYNGKFIKE